MASIDERIRNLEDYLSQDPNNINLLLDLARAYQQVRKPQRAENHLQKALSVAPNNQHVAFEYALLLMHLDRIDEAVAIFSKLLEQGLVEPYIRYNLAYCYLIKHQAADALVALGPLVETYTDLDVTILLLIVQVYYHLQHMDNVEEILRHILKKDPHQISAKGLLAQALYEIGQRDEAQTLSQDVIAHSPENAESLAVTGFLFLEDMHTEAANNTFDALLKHHPKNGRGWLGRGLSRLQKGDLQLAEADLMQCIKYMPQHLGSWNALAWCQISLGQLDVAECTLNQCLELDRNFGETHGTLAAINAMRGDWELATRQAKLALRLDPGSFSGQLAQMLVVHGKGDADRAQQLFTHILQTPLDSNGRTLMQQLPYLVGRNASKTLH